MCWSLDMPQNRYRNVRVAPSRSHSFSTSRNMTWQWNCFIFISIIWNRRANNGRSNERTKSKREKVEPQIKMAFVICKLKCRHFGIEKPNCWNILKIENWMRTSNCLSISLCILIIRGDFSPKNNRISNLFWSLIRNVLYQKRTNIFECW